VGSETQRENGLVCEHIHYAIDDVFVMIEIKMKGISKWEILTKFVDLPCNNHFLSECN